MERFIEKYYNELSVLFDSVRVTNSRRNKLGFFKGIEVVCNVIKRQSDKGGKLFFIGNGASASISSHMSTDFWKNGGIQSLAFNDSSLLTCVSNDFGYRYVFEKPIEMFADKGDVLFAISSSGKSENIIRGVKMACSKKLNIITLSGFNKKNPLCSLGDINFYVPSPSYGYVEIIHQAICHSILDMILLERKYKRK
ncbi:MAG: SIS domain-containing protein [Elusimicrobia bacterium]|nr:SIS domain-containing protein [Elusimicrobiota bacterium]